MVDISNNMDITGNVFINGRTRLSNMVDISNNMDISGNVFINGSLTVNNINIPSDYRIKTNVVPMRDTSFNVDEINPVYYYNTMANQEQIGFIAHELQENLPFLVSGEKDGAELQSVNYIGLIGLLVQEIKELKHRVSELEKYTQSD
jgi:acyl-[acyl carrier protein]--UDP-N-acetylglucosamine O-acyltransferase